MKTKFLDDFQLRVVRSSLRIGFARRNQRLRGHAHCTAGRSIEEANSTRHTIPYFLRRRRRPDSRLDGFEVATATAAASAATGGGVFCRTGTASPSECE